MQPFVPLDAGTTDEFGHGTHVASIIAGTGGRAQGARRGVAFDASLHDFMDAERHSQWFGGFLIFNPKVKAATRFYRDGRLVKRVRDSFAELPVVRRPASYRLVREVDASALLPLTARTQTVWSFPGCSQGPAAQWLTAVDRRPRCGPLRGGTSRSRPVRTIGAPTSRLRYHLACRVRPAHGDHPPSWQLAP